MSDSQSASRRDAGAPPHPRLQTTLREPFSLSGVGMHTGANGSVRLRPAPAGSGIRFSINSVAVPALATEVTNARRCTHLGGAEAGVDTVEHLLSALYGLGVDNAIIEVEGPEIPILDGSARPWVQAIQKAGIMTLDAEAAVLALDAPVAYSEGSSWYVAVPADRLTITCVTHFDHPMLGMQAGSYAAEATFYADEIAPARTFGFAEEIEALLAAGLAKGGSLDNALVVYQDHFSDVLRVPDECLRHKALDLWGDLSLVGGRLNAAITAIKPGHSANVAFARAIMAAAKPQTGAAI